MKAPVLILGGVPRMTTTIARSIHRHGVSVDVATFSALERKIPSRAIRNFVRICDPDVSRDDFVASIERVTKKFHYESLIPGNDVALTAIVDNFDRLRKLFKIACPQPDVVRRVLDKNLTLQLARDCGVPVPKMILVRNSADVPGLVRGFTLPCVLKPAVKHRTEEFKTCTIRSLDDLDRLSSESGKFSPPLLLQEFCPGVGVGVELVIHNGECLAAFQHRRLKELPYGGGVAVMAVAEAVDPVLLRHSTRLLQALNWNGIAMVEFRVDPATGAAVLMEVNGRIWGSISLPVLAGMDFPLYQWQLLQGEAPTIPAQYAVGMQWRWTAGYLTRFNGLLVAKLQGRISPSLWAEFREWFVDFTSGTRDSLWTLRDPLPAIYELLRTICDLLLSDLKATFQRLFRRISSRRRLPGQHLKRSAEPMVKRG
jgi:predicted ATP-grasp superfamily ATP-dependent carboligase